MDAGRQANRVDRREAQRHSAQARTCKPAERQERGYGSCHAVRRRLKVSLCTCAVMCLIAFQVMLRASK